MFTEHFNNILKYNLKTKGTIDILMKKYSNSTKCNIQSTKISALGFEKLTFLFIILITGVILSLIAIVFELKSEPDQRNGQEELKSSSKEIDKLEKIARRLLEGPLQENTEKCLKRILEEYTEETTLLYSARQLPYVVKSGKASNFSISMNLKVV